MTKKARKNLTLLLALVAATVVGATTMPGCTTQGEKTSGGSASSSSIFQPATAKSGSQLWAETCVQCHNIRPPQYYSDAQWATIVFHMRTRANLTGEEQRKITEFLQASN